MEDKITSSLIAQLVTEARDIYDRNYTLNGLYCSHSFMCVCAWMHLYNVLGINYLIIFSAVFFKYHTSPVYPHSGGT